MNQIKITFFTIIIATFVGCNSDTNDTGDFNLLPQVNIFETSGNSTLSSENILHFFPETAFQTPIFPKILKNISQTADKTEAQLLIRIDTSILAKPESYIIDISSKQIKIKARDNAGIFYGLQTLGQMIIDATDQNVNLPVCHIEDSPALEYRAVHLDIKHHKEKLEYYYGLMDWLASYKVNAIIAEVEDKIQYQRQPIVGSDDALTIEQWQKLSEYAMDRNISISPLVQGLGHASFILKHDKYKALRDDPNSDWAFNPLDPETYEVQFDLYLDAMEALPHGKYLHVGGDEVHTTGRGSGKSSLELQLIWLNKVCEFAEDHDRIPIFWDDMPLKHAGLYQPMFRTNMDKERVDSLWLENEHKLTDFLDLFPKNCIYMRWNYSSPEAYGNSKAMEWFMKQGFSVMGATAGQTRWVLMPQNESNIQSIRDFAVPSIENDLNGLLLTLWDDDSPHFELYKRGIMAFAEYTWAGDVRSIEEIKSSYRHRHFSFDLADSKYAFIDKLEKPVGFWKNALLKGNKRNYIAKSNNPLDEAVMDLPDLNTKGAWTNKHEARLEEAARYSILCDSISDKISLMKSKAKRNLYTLQVYEQVNKLVQFTNKSLLLLRELDQTKNKQEEKEILSNLSDLPEEFKSLRSEFERVYGVSRILTKPDNYLLDQDHHSHSANQSINFDWQFFGEIYFLEKLEKQLLN